MKSGSSVFLVGLMGAGKTTVGRLLARRLGFDFLDSDLEIEARCGVKIPVIFEIEGEAGFRDREEAMIAELTARPRIVLATGGGSILREQSRTHLAARGVVVYLCARPADLYLRIRNDRNRPLLATPDPLKTLEVLFEQRDPLYREVADVVVETGRQGTQLLLKQVISVLSEQWQMSA